jgi:type II secretory pathway pseudopilin PulG
MKTSRIRRRQQGFTMLEIVVVLSIMIVIMGIGFASFNLLDDNDPFEKTSQELVQMAKFAHQSAVLQHRGMILAFDKDGFGLVGATDAAGTRRNLPEGMRLFILRYGAKNWEKAEGHRWPFGEQGICEPVKLRLETDTGFREMAFHPLTGTLVE